MIQLYAKLSDVVPTEQEHMPHFEPHLQAQTKLLMERWRDEIPKNGIYDALKVNPDGTLSDGNARYIIAQEQLDKCYKEMFPYASGAARILKWAFLPIDLNWFLGMQVFRGPRLVSLRQDFLPDMTAYLGHKRKLTKASARPYDFSIETKVPVLDNLLALKILWKE